MPRTHATLLKLGWGILLVVFGSSCMEPDLIVGTVRDNFGEPLPGVSVRVKGTTFLATSDDHGLYAVDYVPGSLTLIYDKVGYTTAAREFMISQKMRLPAEEVVLWERPPDGISYVDEKRFLPVATGTVTATRQLTGANSWPLIKHQIAGSYTKLPPRGASPGTQSLMFADSYRSNVQLFKVVSQEVDLQPHIKLETQPNIVQGRVREMDGINLRYFNLEPGRYAFAPLEQQEHGFLDTQWVIQPPIFLFEIDD